MAWHYYRTAAVVAALFLTGCVMTHRGTEVAFLMDRRVNDHGQAYYVASSADSAVGNAVSVAGLFSPAPTLVKGLGILAPPASRYLESKEETRRAEIQYFGGAVDKRK